ncbi:hypothetical protein BG015_009082 [Linnemannia schmuckeri]|uniref:Uncharacterized protein n=1 Tax=Linnemannia schmuckeri TaxID=64567 RepID=A0A9P5S5K4_9FUNG|nr:hypothetical protein BG015_009082 [Linnemannia schmuckeri]
MIKLLSRRRSVCFNASADDLSSRKVITLMTDIGTRLQSDRETNNRQARTITYLLLLSRLKIFQHCLTISGSHQTFTSASPILQRLSKENSKRQDACFPSFSDSDKLLVVHDEAQILGDKWDGRFSSMSPGEPDRPLLSSMLWGFRKNSKIDLARMISDTGLSIYTLNWARSAGSFNRSTRSLGGKNEFEYMEFPGWTGRESMEAYVAGLRYLLPTEGARQALDRLLPPEAIQTITERLVGRFCPAVTAIEKTIARSKPSGWKDAVDDTEASLVSYDHHSEQGNLCHKIACFENKYRANLSIFNELRTRQMFGADRLVLEEAVPELVERAFGRIKIVDGTARAALDEPFVLKAAENFFKMRDSGFMKTMESWVQQSDRAQAYGYAYELMMMSVLIEVFETRAFSDWLHELLITSQCAKLTGNADFMDAHVDTNSLLQGQSIPPFLFLKAKSSGPDIVFYIRVKDKLFPVFVQSKLCQVLTTKDAKGDSQDGICSYD